MAKPHDESSNFCQGRSLSNMSESTRPSSSKATTASTKKGGKQSSSSAAAAASSATGGIKGDVLVQACAEIVRHLVVAAQEGRDVNLNGKQTGTTDGWMDGWMDGWTGLTSLWCCWALLQHSRARSRASCTCPLSPSWWTSSRPSPSSTRRCWYRGSRQSPFEQQVVYVFFCVCVYGVIYSNKYLFFIFQIAAVAVMSKPHRCPHIAMTGNICVYCPGTSHADPFCITKYVVWNC